MANQRRDVQLIVRAKTEGERAVQAMGGALEALFDAAQSGSSDLLEIGRALLTVDKAAATLLPAVDKGAAAFERQRRSLAETQAQLATVKTQMDGATAAVNNFRAASEADGADKAAYTAKIKAAEAALAGLQKQQRALVASIATQEAAINGSRSSLQQLASTANAVEAALAGVGDETAQAMARGTAATEEQTRALREQAATARESAAADAARGRFDKFLGITDNPNGRNARGSAAVFEAQALAEAAAMKEQAVAAEAAALAEGQLTAQTAKLRATIDPLAAIQNKLNAELAEANRLYKAGKISAQELGLAQVVLARNAKDAADHLERTGRGEKGKLGILGLKPYELTNLGYQLNDVATQLASGTSLAQTLGQQGGQLLQIFPRVGIAILGALANPVVLGGAAILTSFALGIKRIADEEGRLRTFNATLAAMGDGANYNAQALSDTTHELDRFGMSAGQAVASVRAFLKEGFNPALIEDFGRTAQNMADVLGIEVVDAAKKIAPAFTAGFAAIAKLDDEINFLTATEREHIRTQFEEGRATEARAEAANILKETYADAARQARGPWSDAARNFHRAWSDMLDKVADTGALQVAANVINALAGAVRDLADAMGNVGSIESLDEKIRDLRDEITMAQAVNIGGINDRWIADAEKRIEALKRQWNTLVERRDRSAGADVDPQESDSDQVKKADAALAESDRKRLAAAQGLTHAKRLELAYTEALRAAQDAKTSPEAARASALNAQLIEQRKINKEITAEKEKQRRADEAAIKAFSSKVIGVESGGDRNAKNPLSSATGLGQFIESTWLKLFKEHFPDRAKSMTDGAILALRRDSEISKRMIEIYARENASVLQKAGKSITEANLYLLHFLGPVQGKRVISARADTPVANLVNAGTMSANKSILQGKTAGQVRTWAGGKFGEAFAADASITERLAKIEEDRLARQAEFNARVDDENEKRTLGVASLESQRRLIGEALLAEQRKQAIADAVLQKQQEIDKTNADLRAKGQQEIAFTKEQRAEIEKTTGAYFDLSRAKDVATAKRTAVEQPVDDLADLRTSIMEQIEFYQKAGNNSAVGVLDERLVEVNARLDDSIAKALEFWRAVAGDPVQMANLGLTAQQVENIVLKLQVAGSAANDLGRQFLQTGRQFNESFAEGGVSIASQFAEAIANGRNAVVALGSAMLQTGADFLRQIGEMIIKQQLFNMLSAQSKSGAGGIGGAVAGAIGSLFMSAAPLTAAGAAVATGGATVGAGAAALGVSAAGLMAAANVLMVANSIGSAGIFHGGGIAGAASRTRAVSPAVFANAARYHKGGFAGLRPGEVPAILERGEEILTKSDVRHRNNGGGASQGSAPARSIRQILVMNEAEMHAAMSGGAGEEVIVTAIRRNRAGIKQILDNV